MVGSKLLLSSSVFLPSHETCTCSAGPFKHLCEKLSETVWSVVCWGSSSSPCLMLRSTLEVTEQRGFNGIVCYTCMSKSATSIFSVGLFLCAGRKSYNKHAISILTSLERSNISCLTPLFTLLTKLLLGVRIQIRCANISDLSLSWWLLFCFYCFSKTTSWNELCVCVRESHPYSECQSRKIGWLHA